MDSTDRGTAPALSGSSTSRDFAKLKRNSTDRTDGGSRGDHLHGSKGHPDTGVHEFVSAGGADDEARGTYCSNTLNDQMLADVRSYVGSPRSEGSGESMDVNSAGHVHPASGLENLDTLELAQLYLNRTRADTSQAGSAPGGSGVADLKTRTLGDGAENGDMAKLDLNAIREQLRQRDETLELAARVGQELLERNAALESDLMSQSSSRDILLQETAQLKHDISVKERLLKMYYAEMEDEDQQLETLHRRRSFAGVTSPARVCLSPTRSISSMSNVSEEAAHLLQVECEELRSANKLLAEESALLQQQAALLDQREQELIAECVRRLNEATQGLAEMQDAHQERELVAQRHANEIAELQATNERMHDAYTVLSGEKSALQTELEDMSSRQSLLSSQVLELQEQYVECLSLFRQAQSELAMYRKHASLPPGTMTPTTPNLPATSHQPSIGSELSLAMRMQQQQQQSSSPVLAGRVTPPHNGALDFSAGDLASSTPATPTNPRSPSSTPIDVETRFVSSPLKSPVNTRSQAQVSGSSFTAPVTATPSSSAVMPTNTTPTSASRPASLVTSAPFTGSIPSTPSQGPGLFSAGASPALPSRTQHANQIMSAVRSLDLKQTHRPTGGVYHRNRPSSISNHPASQSPLSSRRQSLANISAESSISSTSVSSERRDSDVRVFSAPEKLRIVKPMEGSLTLLKWKLLALQQQTGADALQQALAMPGIHVKNEGSERGSSVAGNSGRSTPSSGNSTINASMLASSGDTMPNQPVTSTPLASSSRIMPSPRVYRSSLGLGGVSSLASTPTASQSKPESSQRSVDAASSSPLLPSSKPHPTPSHSSTSSPATPRQVPLTSEAPSSNSAAKEVTSKTGFMTPALSRLSGIGLGGILSGFSAGRSVPVSKVTGLSTPAGKKLSSNFAASEVDGDDGVE